MPQNLFVLCTFLNIHILTFQVMRSWVALGLVATAAVLATAKESKKEDVGTVIGIDLGTTYSW